MKKSGLLQAELQGILASLGHTQSIVIGDAGLPVPPGVRKIDLAVRAGLPSFADVLRTVLPECVFERCTLAEEIAARNPETLKAVETLCGDMPRVFVPHEQLKKLSESAVCVVRTGETSPYANVLLTAGVNF